MLSIRFVYKADVEEQESLPFTKVRSTTKRIPSGKAHFFSISYDGRLHEKSLCGITKSEIGDKTLERSERAARLPVCEKCANEWKKSANSQWASWAEMVK